jgi:uncharacterized repeat protein (TIGR03803 family)
MSKVKGKSLASQLLNGFFNTREESKTRRGSRDSIPNCRVETLENRRMMSVSYPYTFTGASTSGLNPKGGLVMDSSGNIFGIASNPVSGTDGELYEMVKGTSGYTFRLLYTFTLANSSAHGYGPVGNLVLDSSGNLYGTTDSGGANSVGNIFEMTRTSINGTSPTANTLYSFSASTGQYPENGLAISTSGTLTLYGTTTVGGNHYTDLEGGDGVVFKYVPSTSTYTVLHYFNSSTAGGNTDLGCYPSSTVAIDSSGNLYCTTTNSTSGSPDGGLYKIAGSTATSIFDWGATGTGGDNIGLLKGFNPIGNLSTSSSGVVFGTTEDGGATYNAGTGANNFGVVYQVSTTGLAHVWSFPTPTGSGNWNPEGGLVVTSTYIYGTTVEGGFDGVGDLFKINLSSNAFTEIMYFSSSGPNEPIQTTLVLDSSGNLYGTTFTGSPSPLNYGDGTFFEYSSPLALSSRQTGASSTALLADAAIANVGTATFSNAPVEDLLSGRKHSKRH